MLNKEFNIFAISWVPWIACHHIMNPHAVTSRHHVDILRTFSYIIIRGLILHCSLDTIGQETEDGASPQKHGETAKHLKENSSEIRVNTFLICEKKTVKASISTTVRAAETKAVQVTVMLVLPVCRIWPTLGWWEEEWGRWDHHGPDSQQPLH